MSSCLLASQVSIYNAKASTSPPTNAIPPWAKLLAAALATTIGAVAEELELAPVLVAPIVDLSSVVLVLAMADVVGATRVVLDAAVALELEIVADASFTSVVVRPADAVTVTIETIVLEQGLGMALETALEMVLGMALAMALADEDETEDTEDEDEEEAEPPVIWNG